MGYIGAGISRFNTADELTVTGDATIDTTTLVVDSTNNNVGIGTASPEDFGGGYTTLEIAGSSTANGGVFKTATSDSAGTGTAGTEMLMYSNNGGGVIAVTSSDPLLFQTAGAEVMRLTSAGLLGLGVTAPDGKLNVVSTAHNNGSIFDSAGTTQLWLRDTDAASNQKNWGFQVSGGDLNIVRANDDRASGFVTPIYIQQAPANSLVIDTSGSVGIGTVPKTFNTVDGALQIGTRQTLTSFSNDVGIGYNHYYNSGWKYTNTDVARRFSSTSTAPFIWQYAASGSADAAITWSEAMRLDSSGNLLVGQTSNNAHLNSASGDGLTISSSGEILQGTTGESMILNRRGSDGNIIRFRKDGSTVGTIGVMNTNNPYIANDADNSGLQFGSGSITPSYDGAGQDNSVDLGSSSTRFKDGYFSNYLYANLFAGVGDTNTLIEFPGSNVMKFVTGGGEKARFDSSGRLLISTSSLINSDGAYLQSNGGSNLAFGFNVNYDGTLGRFYRSSSIVGSISVTTSNTAYNTSSDRRLKSNIEDAASASDKIDAIQVRQFDWNVDDSHQDYGLIAQELQPIEPLAVTGDADSDEMMGVDYSKLVPMLIKEIQELRSRVAALEE